MEAGSQKHSIDLKVTQGSFAILNRSKQRHHYAKKQKWVHSMLLRMLWHMYFPHFWAPSCVCITFMILVFIHIILFF